MTALPYLRGKKDPYESTISIPGYSYEKSYSAAELTKLLQSKGHSIGTVASVQASYTRMGNIYSIKFTDTSGKCVTVQKESCRLLFSVPSMRFTIHSGSGSAVSAEPALPAAEPITSTAKGAQFLPLKAYIRSLAVERYPNATGTQCMCALRMEYPRWGGEKTGTVT